MSVRSQSFEMPKMMKSELVELVKIQNTKSKKPNKIRADQKTSVSEAHI